MSLGLGKQPRRTPKASHADLGLKPIPFKVKSPTDVLRGDQYKKRDWKEEGKEDFIGYSRVPPPLEPRLSYFILLPVARRSGDVPSYHSFAGKLVAAPPER